jgi:glucoamylase
MTGPIAQAFGAPGVAPTWSSSDKDFVTSSLGRSRLWATIGHGVLNEIYWPSTGEPRVRDVTFYLVGADRWIDLKRDRRYRLSRPGPGTPLITVVHEGDDYAVELEFIPDPDRDVILVRYEVRGPYRLVAIAAPHLDGEGTCLRAWADGELYAVAESGTAALCLAASGGFVDASVGYVGASDGWQDLARHGRLTWSFPSAERGNLALTAGLEPAEGAIAIAVSERPTGARTLALSSLAEGVAAIRETFVAGWGSWCQTLVPLGGPVRPHGVDPDLMARMRDEAIISATVLKMHEDRNYPGALVASLSVPWGASTNTLGGYHLVWPRDATLAAFGFIVMNQLNDAARILAHQIATQLPEGHWPQNYYPSGAPFWVGLQLDEAAFPVLLAAKLRELGVRLPDGTGAMVRRAVRYVGCSGPASPQDRWEENPGINPFTVAVAIAALVAAEPWLEAEDAAEALDIADDWCARLEEWCYVRRSPWTEALGVAGHYVRLCPDPGWHGGPDVVALRNRDGETIEAARLVSMEFSYIPRLGLRAPDDPRIRDTVRVVDHVLATATPSGTVYHRYNEDGYGEHADGAPFDGTGIGRGWPFLVGERGHLALGLGEDPGPHLETMLACASAGGLMPEQVWDADPIPGRGLEPGRPSGSAMPLLWTHAEFLKLLYARHTGVPVERLDAVATRYASPRSPRAVRWRDGAPVAALAAGPSLVIEHDVPFALHFGWDGWQGVADRQAVRGRFGMWGVRIKPEEMAGHRTLQFTRRRADGWEGADHSVELAASDQSR